MPSPEQMQAMQRQLAAEAQKAGMTVPEFVEKLKKQAVERMQLGRQQQQLQQQQQQQQGGEEPPHLNAQGQRQIPTPGKPHPIVPGPPDPKALAIANFLKGQDLKPRTCILNGERKDMFKG